MAFYRDALGFAVVVDVPGVYVELDTGAARIGLVARAVMANAVVPLERTAGSHHGAAGDVVLQVRVANVDAAAEWLAERGVELASTPHDQPNWMLRVAHVRDPAGHLVELTTPLAS
jgi:catechol 2,3-dioxygenase-like lactoylglutathione lyase family enzyme